MFQIVVILSVVVSVLIEGAPVNVEDHRDGFWFGTQDMACLKGKAFVRMKRGVPEVPTISYIHRLIYYKTQVFEWGNGMKGYHYGIEPAIAECPVTWQQAPAGYSQCQLEVVERFSREYRAQYGGYNLVTNNCHHFVNRVAIILSSQTCQIGMHPDRWQYFSDNFWSWIRHFVAVFESGTIDHPQEIRRAPSRDPNVHDDWPIVQWY